MQLRIVNLVPFWIQYQPLQFEYFNGQVGNAVLAQHEPSRD